MVRKKATPAKAPPEDADLPSAPPDTSSLRKLLSSDSTVAYELLYQLRACGLGSMFQIPQLVVCGDQSAGKSSVLEALTEVPFPTKSNLCTRFATQIVMRRANADTIRAKIIPDDKLSAREKTAMSAFSRSIQDCQQLPEVIEAATAHMGLDKADKAKASAKPRAFSRNVLSIEIEGPEVQPLILVDLPGWINTQTKDHTDEDVHLIQELIVEYIAQEKTIVLPVISAKSDLSSQAILTQCRKVGALETRTLGIITKLDKVDAGSDEEKNWLEVARNRDVQCGLGWHVLRNRTYEERNESSATRNMNEKDFFKRGAYRTISSDNKGVESLRTKLGDLQFAKIKKELPGLLQEADVRHHETSLELKQLGRRRSNVEEMRRALMSSSVDFSRLMQQAYEGTYSDPDFFPEISGGFANQDHKHLRASVRGRQEDFMAQMQMYGSKFRIYETEKAGGTHKRGAIERNLPEKYRAARKFQTVIQREEFEKRAHDLHLATRGPDLPGLFNSDLVARLYQDLTVNWEEMALDHIVIIDELCCQLVKAAVHQTGPKDLAESILDKLKPIMKRRYGNAYRELQRLIEDKNGLLGVCDPSHADKVQDLHDHEKNQELDRARALAVNPPANATSVTVFGAQQTPQPPKRGPRDSNMISAQKAVDHVIVVFNKRLQTFTDNVTQQVIERNLLKGLADIFSPKQVQEYTDKEVEQLAVESKSTQSKREELEHFKEILDNYRNEVDKLLHPHKRRAAETKDDDDDNVPYSKRAALD
ncbi:hypothetical protein PRZ48_012295 [Zasmidium cellare]|uniref:Uncharacterized protein n=1 Tax=Zasmidium cellare TaxID=395010 RepID=A0ABR0E4Y2_ZASCE|nr:hypothetical protein PRZ48_012295 [Zasmidium cellare]